MDANLTALLTVVVTSIASVIIALINAWKTGRVEKKVDAGNAITAKVETLTNGNNAVLQQKLEAANSEIARLSRLLPPDGE